MQYFPRDISIPFFFALIKIKNAKNVIELYWYNDVWKFFLEQFTSSI